MPRSLAGAGRPVCASGKGAPDAKHTKIDATASVPPAHAAATSRTAKGAPEESAAASSKARPKRPAAPGRRD